jgi:hypothetical protein
VNVRDDRVPVLEECLPGICQPDAAPAAGALDEPMSDHALKRGHLLTDGRLRVAQRRCGGGEGPLARYRLQRQEMPKLDLGPVVQSHSARS